MVWTCRHNLRSRMFSPLYLLWNVCRPDMPLVINHHWLILPRWYLYHTPPTGTINWYKYSTESHVVGRMNEPMPAMAGCLSWEMIVQILVMMMKYSDNCDVEHNDMAVDNDYRLPPTLPYILCYLASCWFAMCDGLLLYCRHNRLAARSMLSYVYLTKRRIYWERKVYSFPATSPLRERKRRYLDLYEGE